MGLLVGLDSLAIGNTWLGLGVLPLVSTVDGGGLCSYPCRLDAPWPLMSKAVQFLPRMLSCILLQPNPMRGNRGYWLVAALAFATTLSGTDDHRVVLPEISRLTESTDGTGYKIFLDEGCLRECSKRSCGLAVSYLLEPFFIKPGCTNSIKPTGVDRFGDPWYSG